MATGESQFLVRLSLTEKIERVCPTEVLHVLIPNDGQSTALRLAGASAGAEALEDHDTVRSSSSYESGAVGETSPLCVKVESDVRERVSSGTQEQCHVANKPRKLQRLRELNHALLKRQACWRRRCHGSRRLRDGARSIVSANISVVNIVGG